MIGRAVFARLALLVVLLGPLTIEEDCLFSIVASNQIQGMSQKNHMNKNASHIPCFH